jgi:hypothetical protein
MRNIHIPACGGVLKEEEVSEKEEAQISEKT